MDTKAGDSVNKLNSRQQKFAEFYAQSGNTVQSALNAGYSENYANSRAYELLENVGVAEYIKELSEKAKDERIMSVKDRQVMLSEIAKDELNEPSDRIRAVDTLNKMTGEYLNRVDVNASLDTAKDNLEKILMQVMPDE